MICAHCDRELVTENDKNRGICFKHHVQGIKFGFRGASIGQNSWNDTTIRETQRYYENLPAFKEGKIEKIPARAELI